jgi:FolB domain-containing protein
MGTQDDCLIIRISDLATRVHIGVSEAERAQKQALVVSTALHLAAGPSFEARDRLDETIDYDALIEFVRRGLPELSPTQLIETMAERVAQFALDLSVRIEAVEVKIVKPAVLGADGAVSVSLTRRRP